jgi:Protein of unknown function (DUF3102)
MTAEERELLAWSEDGCTDTLLGAHGFTFELMVGVVRKGLARAKAELISAAWQKGVASIIETGSRLIEAKAEIDHGEFLAMIQLKLPFGRRTAHRLMTIAADSVLANGTHGSHLPPSWRTLYELAGNPQGPVCVWFWGVSFQLTGRS